jgi:hypothetical protein
MAWPARLEELGRNLTLGHWVLRQPDELTVPRENIVVRSAVSYYGTARSLRTDRRIGRKSIYLRIGRSSNLSLNRASLVKSSTPDATLKENPNDSVSIG